MVKQRNRLYANPQNAKTWEAWTKVTMFQPFNMFNKKVGISAVVYPENLFLNFAQKSEKTAKKFLERFQKNIFRSKIDLPDVCSENEKREFLFHSFNAIIFSYTSVETYSNNFIELYCEEDKIEVYKKFSLQDKINNVMSEIIGIKSFSEVKQDIWASFLVIENMRHQIIHSQYSYFNTPFTDWWELILSKVFNWKFIWCTDTSFNIIDYYKKWVLEKMLKPIKREPKEWQIDSVSWWWRWLQSTPLK